MNIGTRGAAALLGACVALVAAAPQRNDYANARFNGPLEDGFKAFYARDFKTAQDDFEKALAVVPDNTLAISFLNAAAAQRSGELDVLTNVEEDAASGAPKNYVNHIRLGFSYMFQSAAGRDRSQDARDELQASVALDPAAVAAHVGLGIMRFNERSANRAKLELQQALEGDPNNVLAREYLSQLYQTDLRDPERGLRYIIDVPNLVPGYADIQFHIGSLLHDLKQSDAALPYLRRGIELDSGHVGEAGLHGYTLIARILIEQHKLVEAQRVLNQAIVADTDTIYARTLLAKIKAGDYDTPSPEPGAPARPH
jgi:Tfp pilus assembly protein PilF